MKKKLSVWKIILIVIAAIAVIIPSYIFISGYIKSLPKIKYTLYDGQEAAAAYPDAKFAVISDIHFYDKSLGTTGSAFEKVLNADRKLLVESEEMLDFTLEKILASDVEFVLISGDLTKDGEKINHERVSQKLQKLVDGGIKVFVVPGNHDINNYNAESYSGDTAVPVDNITADEFAVIYKNMGYNSAIKRDTNSLSYVAEPVPGLWILGIDSCRYDENTADGHGAVVGGKITQEQEKWLAEVLEEAAQLNKAVITLMHHGVVEHWKGQSKLHADYLVDDYKHFGKYLASYNVRLAFTGHYHAQSIARADFGSNYINDIETGSLLTAPSPIRLCELKNGSLSVFSEMIIDQLRPGTDFAEESRAFVKRTIILEAKSILRKYKVSEKDSDYIGELVGVSFDAHYRGDVDASLSPSFDKKQVGLWGRIVYSMQKYVIEGLWKEIPPDDNNVVIELP